MSKELGGRDLTPERVENWLKNRSEETRLKKLTDVSDVKELDRKRDLGFSSDYLISWIYGTDRFLKLTDYNSLVAEENFRFLKEQLALALKREEEQGQKEQRRIKRRKILKENITKVGLPLLAIASILGVGGAAYQTIFSPEATAQRQTQEMADKLRFEKEHILGLTPSLATTSDWRVRYSAKEENVDYVEGTGKDDKQKVGIGTAIYFDNSFIPTSTGVRINDYKRPNGKLGAKLHITTKGSNPNQERILRDESADDVDNRVVVFEKLNNVGEVVDTKYVSISRMESDPRYFKVVTMQRVPTK